MNKKSIDTITKKIEKVITAIGQDIPRGSRYYDDEPNCNIQWDTLRGYTSDTMTITEHSVGTHTFEDGKQGFHIFGAVRVMYQGREVFSVQYDNSGHVGKKIYRSAIVYVPGRWENKLTALFEKANGRKIKKTP